MPLALHRCFALLILQLQGCKFLAHGRRLDSRSFIQEMSSEAEDVKNLLSTFPEDTQRDADAIVLGGALVSEENQMAAARTVIMSAEKYALITTYAIDIMTQRKQLIEGMPEGRELSPTLRAMFEAFSMRQQEELNVLLAYQKSAWLQNIALGKKRTFATHKVDADSPQSNPWIQAVMAYNVLVEQGKTIPGAVKLDNRSQAKFWLLGLDFAGLAGSHHAKSLVNDRGLLGVVGNSMAHIGKDYQMDSGSFVLSDVLAKWECNYFKKIFKYTDVLSQLSMGPDTPVLDTIKGKSAGKKAVDLLEQQVLQLSRTPWYSMKKLTLQGPLEKYSSLGIPEAIGAHLAPFIPVSPLSIVGSFKGDVLMLHNPPQTNVMDQMWRKFDSKPVGKMFKLLLEWANPGDTLKIRQACIEHDAREFLYEALEAGINIDYLRAVSEEESECSQMLYDMARMPEGVELTLENSQNQRDLEDAELHAMFRKPFKRGTKAVFEYRPATMASDAFKMGKELPPLIKRDHAKVYILEQREGDQVFDTVVVGTFNLDAQSIYRSHENSLVVLRTESHALKAAVFDELWDDLSQLTQSEAGSSQVDTDAVVG